MSDWPKGERAGIDEFFIFCFLEDRVAGLLPHPFWILRWR